MAENTEQEIDLSDLRETAQDTPEIDLSDLRETVSTPVSDKTMVEMIGAGLMLEYEVEKRWQKGAPDAPKVSTWDLVKKGLDKSVVGAAVHQDITRLAPSEEEIQKIAPEERALSEEELLKLPHWKRQLHNLTTLGADLPLMAIGAVIGTIGGAPTGPVAAVTGAAGAFALPEGLREMYVHKLRNRKDTDFFDFTGFWDELWESFKSTGKGLIIGAATGGAGVGTGKLMGETLFTPLVKAIAEGSTMVGAGAAFEGRVPGWNDFMDAAIMIGVMHVSMRAGVKGAEYIRNEAVNINEKNVHLINNKLLEIYSQSGVTPQQVLMDIKSDPVLVKELLSNDTGIPTRYAKQEMVNRVELNAKLEILDKEITTRNETADKLKESIAKSTDPDKLDSDMVQLGAELKQLEIDQGNYYYEVGKNSPPVGSITDIKNQSDALYKALNAYKDIHADTLASLYLGKSMVDEVQTELFGSREKAYDKALKIQQEFNELNRLSMFYNGQLELTLKEPSRFEYQYMKGDKAGSVSADNKEQAIERISKKENMSRQDIADKVIVFDVVPDPTDTLTFGRMINRLAKLDVFEFPKDLMAEIEKSRAPEPDNVIKRTKDWIAKHTNKIHEFEFLNTDPRFVETKYKFRQFQKDMSLASDKAANSLNDVIRGLPNEEYKLFNDVVALRYIKDTYEHNLKKYENREIDVKPKLPFGIMDIEQVNVELSRLENVVGANEKVLESLNKRKEAFSVLQEDHRRAMESIGVELQRNYNYDTIFKDRIIRATEIAGESNKGGTGDKKEKGIGKDAYYTDYIYIENKVLTQMYNEIQTANVLAFMKENLSNPRKQMAMVRADKAADKIVIQEGLEEKGRIQHARRHDAWKDFLDEGDVLWTPQKDGVFYVDGSLTGKDYAHIIKELFNLKTDAEAKKFLAENPDLTSGLDQTKNTLAGLSDRTMVLPKEVADTIRKLESVHDPDLVGKSLMKATSAWKKWVLYNPYSVIKYNIRNLTGDMDIAFAGNPHGFLYTPRAVKDIYDYYINKKTSPEMRDWIERGGNITLIQAQEIEALNRLNTQFGEKGWTDTPGIKQIWKTIRLGTDARESVLRFANYLDYLKSMEADIAAGGQGVPRNFGASKDRDVMALRDIKDRAFFLSNDLLGAYDRVSEYGQALRKYVYPFWSFPEINFRRYTQLVANAVKNPAFARAEGERLMSKYEKLARLTPMISLRLGMASLKVSALTMLASFINNVIWGKEDENGLTLEDKLPEDVKKRPHIIVGKDDEGDPYYFTRIGSLGDLLEWGGIQNAPDLFVKRVTGKISEEEFVNEFFGKFTPEGEIDRNIVNVFKKNIDSAGKKVLNDIVPIEKIGIGALLDYETYPEIRAAREPGFTSAIAKSLGLIREYKHISNLLTEAGYPMSEKSWGEWALQKVIYKSDTFETAYFDNIQAKNKFLKDTGKGSSVSRYSDTGNALYNAKLAMRFGDEELADLYIQKYYELGGTSEGVQNAFKSMDPLANLSDKEKGAYLNSLTEDGRIRLMMAYEFYGALLSGQGTKKAGE